MIKTADRMQTALAVPDPSSTRWPVSKHLVTGTLAVLVLIGVFGGWAIFANISGAVIVNGRLEVDQNRQVIQHPDGGVVAQILVKEGTLVEAGDLLIRLDADDLRSELAVVEGQLFEVVAQRARNEAERDGTDILTFDPLLVEINDPTTTALMDGQINLHAARRMSEDQQKEQLARRREQIASQITGMVAQQTSVSAQTELIGQELISQQSLFSRGLTEAARVLNLQREQASLDGRAGELAAAIAEAEGRMTEIDIAILQIDSTRRQEALSALRDGRYTELELIEHRRTLRGRLDRLDIRAPMSGVVYDMQVFAPRSVLRPADPVMFLVPQDRPLMIAVEVDPIHIDQIFTGQQVNLRFSAFDQSRTPELLGEVIQISADTFENRRNTGEFYRAEIMLSAGQLDLLPFDFTLIPGMPVEAFIVTGSRSPLAYLIKPLSDYFAKAFRET